MEKCGYRSVIACSAWGAFCSTDINLTIPPDRLHKFLDRALDAARPCTDQTLGEVGGRIAGIETDCALAQIVSLSKVGIGIFRPT